MTQMESWMWRLRGWLPLNEAGELMRRKTSGWPVRGAFVDICHDPESWLIHWVFQNRRRLVGRLPADWKTDFPKKPPKLLVVQLPAIASEMHRGAQNTVIVNSLRQTRYEDVMIHRIDIWKSLRRLREMM